MVMVVVDGSRKTGVRDVIFKMSAPSRGPCCGQFGFHLRDVTVSV